MRIRHYVVSAIVLASPQAALLSGLEVDLLLAYLAFEIGVALLVPLLLHLLSPQQKTSSMNIFNITPAFAE